MTKSWLFATFKIVFHYYCVSTVLRECDMLIVVSDKYRSKNYYWTVSWEKESGSVGGKRREKKSLSFHIFLIALSSAGLSCSCKIQNSVFHSVQVLISHSLPDWHYAMWLTSVTCCLLAWHVSPGNILVHSSRNWI